MDREGGQIAGQPVGRAQIEGAPDRSHWGVDARAGGDAGDRQGGRHPGARRFTCGGDEHGRRRGRQLRQHPRAVARLSMATFRALVLHEEAGKVVPRIEAVDEADLPPGEVTVRVECSTLNYKDGMILQGVGRLVRRYPHVPGVDFVGTVERSKSPEFAPGDPVILTGWRVGETQWGGYAEKARVKASFLVRRPDGLSARQAMAIGTAGFTAMLAVMALERHSLRPDAGDVLVTGAAGGLGGVALLLLSNLGYRAVASTGRPELRGYLSELGAAELVDRASLATKPSRPLDSERWAGAADAVGGATLATILT